MSHNLSIPIALVDSFFAAAKRRDVDLTRVFSDVGLNYARFQQMLEADPLQRMELDYISPLLRSLWAQLGDEASGFFARPFKLGTFSMMCHAIITSSNLRRALLRSGKFVRLMSDDLSLELKEVGDEAHLDIIFSNELGFDDVFLITSLYIIWIRLSCWLIQRPILIDRIEFEFDKPIFYEEYELMFPCRHSFAQPFNRVVFNKKYLSLPLRQDSNSLTEFLQNAPASLLTQFRSDDSMTADVKRVLLSRSDGNNDAHLEFDKMSFDNVADVLHMTTHTLRRRLKDEGNSYQEIKDSIRRDQALVLLDRPELSAQDVALLLGFSESAAFNRAFKKWTGITPGAYRTDKA